MKWRIDQPALDEARNLLEITYPVRVRVLENGGSIKGMAGKYHGIGHWGPAADERLDEPAHHISLSGYLSAFMANDCLWHELTHAAQAEDYLPDDQPEAYQIANAGLRQAFGKEMRGIRTERGITKTRGVEPAYADVSFEEEARKYMDNGKDIKIIVPTEPEKAAVTTTTPSEKEFLYRWRVDMWDASGKTFINTVYVLADDEFAAKKWARDNHMGNMRWSSKVYAYKCRKAGE